MSRYEDERGVIEDMVQGPVSLTRISTKKGAVRGNHFHAQTVQWTLVLSGKLLIAHSHRIPSVSFRDLGPGEVIETPAGTPHAWKALEDTDCLVFTQGPRGEDYESDTHRLAIALL